VNKKKKILLVDDDRNFIQAMNTPLRANGYDTAFATDAMSALSQARNYPPDLILLNLGLPVREGFTIMERMRNIGSLASIPVIVLTARDARINREQAIQAGARAFFHKPPDGEDFLKTVRATLGNGHGENKDF
jgi:DNA-binding response OmpR family regulator